MVFLVFLEAQHDKNIGFQIDAYLIHYKIGDSQSETLFERV